MKDISFLTKRYKLDFDNDLSIKTIEVPDISEELKGKFTPISGSYSFHADSEYLYVTYECEKEPEIKDVIR